MTEMSETSGTPATTRTVLPEISSRAWEHPADRTALTALRRLKGFDQVLKVLSAMLRERQHRLLYLASSAQVGPRQFADLDALLDECVLVLDAQVKPDLFVSQSPEVNAYAIGMDSPFIVVTSGMYELMTHDEMRFVLGHELGHALSGHAVYRTILLRILTLSGILTAIPLGGIGLRMIVAALMEWVRKSELSADRAGLLATQDPGVAYRALMKMSSGGHLADLDQTSFFEQGSEYDAAVDIRDSVLKLLLIERRSHPMPVSRASELRRWVDSGAYTAIVAGTYPTRDEDANAKVSEAAQEAAASYTEAFRETQDTLGKLMHDAAGWLGSAKGWIDERWRRPGDEDAS